MRSAISSRAFWWALSGAFSTCKPPSPPPRFSSSQAEDQEGPGEEENRGGGEGGLHVENAPERAHQKARDEIADRIDRGESTEGHAVLLLGHEFRGEGVFEGFLRANVETSQNEDHDEQR